MVWGFVASEDALGLFGPENAFRLACQQIATSSIFDTVVISVIMLSAFMLSLDSPTISDELKDTMEIMDMVFMGVFTVEMMIKIFAFGFYATQPSIVPTRVPDHMTHCLLSIGSRLPASVIRLGGWSLPQDVIEVDWAETQIHPYWHQTWNRLDGSIVAMTWLENILTWLPPLKVLRVGRSLRPLRLVHPDAWSHLC